MPKPIPEAETPEQPMEMPPLRIGPPFAISHDVELLDELNGQHKLCSAVVRCEPPCAQVFRINLLAPERKQCPRCGVAYTHVLLVAREDDDEILQAAMGTVLRSNGYQLPGDDDDEGAELEHDEGDQGDELERDEGDEDDEGDELEHDDEDDDNPIPRGYRE